eukprot:CAMPEP_0171558338 /NCGR_PEP_ID=MMETSP0960-20121227/11931_1 /TAXON_ID=87120 /ORGANISM="Aurantiochytrium limacinum, Strain ATCCMYA-1381" /LENGTH=43 /DNA_ID= /DNA_START= /DNA_END= /DNA_ORIENTATION=
MAACAYLENDSKRTRQFKAGSQAASVSRAAPSAAACKSGAAGE